MLQLQGINREQIIFSNLESQISKDNEIRLFMGFNNSMIVQPQIPYRYRNGFEYPYFY